MNEKADYSNWITKKIVVLLGSMGGIVLLLFFISFLHESNALFIGIRIVLLCFTLLFLGACCYMGYARKLLSYEGGGVQGKILDNVLSYLHWDGNGKLLDIGCGSGAMGIKAAKKYPDAQVTGIDYWGVGWEYAEAQCRRNAEIEGVVVHFQKGDAFRLDFPDESFNAAVSNFVFHEVRSQPDKLALIREAIRVIKPGGVFSFQDVFYAKSHYKDLDAILSALTNDVSELNFVDTRKNTFVPKFLKTPMVAGNMGLIYGRK